jgi:hypothetical protein
MLSTYRRDLTLNDIKSANKYIAFYSSDPGRAGTSGTDITTSVTSGRKLIATSDWGSVTSSGDARQIANSASLSLGNAPSTITVTHIAIWTASSGGNCEATGVCSFTTTSGVASTIGIGLIIIRML